MEQCVSKPIVNGLVKKSLWIKAQAFNKPGKITLNYQKYGGVKFHKME